MSAPTIDQLPHGITVVDTGFQRPGFAASFIIRQGDKAAFVDAGNNAAVPHLLAGLTAVGLTPQDVSHVIVTHVHLDHAGGAGRLMAACPNATLVAHPRAARHMVDPSALWAGAAGVYGEDYMHATYGELVPVPQERVLVTSDGFVLDFDGRPLLFLDTPGHARHHHCVWDQTSRGWFTGDTHGLSYPEFVSGTGRYILPTTTPVQFDPVAAHTSLDRLQAQHPASLYLTHFGRVAYDPALTDLLRRQLDSMVEISRRHASLTGREREDAIAADLRELYVAEAAAVGVDLPALGSLLDLDVTLNAQGLGVWLDQSAG